MRRARELSLTQTRSGQWIRTATQSAHTQLQDANLELWSAQNKVDRFLEELQNVDDFAEPLLTDALMKQYGVDVDVRTTYLHLYLPKERPWYAIDVTGGVVTRTVSLLNAALHNFARSETCEPDSDFISQPDERGLFDVLPVKRKMSIAQFQTLCRELDIGARYARYLENRLLPGDAVARRFLQLKIIDSEKAAFKAAVQQALMTGDIDADASDLILKMLDGQRNLTRKGRVMHFAELSILDSRLAGIVLITPDLYREHRREVVPIFAYVPQDPEHPLKEYPSTVAFMNELTRQLRDNPLISSTGMTYRQFFSRFVDQPERGHFFGGLQQRLFEVKWHQKDPLDPGPSWREVPVEQPNLRFSATPIRGEFWKYRFEQKLNKILNDARHIAVSTADTDRNARWAWWENFKKIVSDIFNVALMVVTPFVPGLGELMMAYTAYQIANDVIEGFVDMTLGLWNEAVEHIVGVVEDAIQLAAFAAGANIGEVVRLKLSPLIEGMKPVTLPNGEPRLWHPDLRPYELPDVKLSADSGPDELGLHTHQGQDILPLDETHFAVQKDPQTGNYHVKHPHRADAYSPELRHNGLGAWTHEGENPRAWSTPKLLRRLGHTVDGLTDADLERVRIASGTDDGALRRMYIDNTAAPPLLDDSLERLHLQRQARHSIERIRTGLALDPSSYWFEPLATYLDGWPADKSLKVYHNDDLTGPFRQYGNPQATDGQTLSISLSHLLSNRFAPSLVNFLDEAELQAVLGRPMAKSEQVQALRDRLADEANRLLPDIVNQLYQGAQASDDPQIRLVRHEFAQLPSRAVKTLLSRADSPDLKRMGQEQRLPLSIKIRAREADFEVRANHAYEGFYDDAQWVPETESLVLNALRIHSDTFNELRIEVREGSDAGPLRCSVGTQDASTVRILVRDEVNCFEVWDAQNHKLREAAVFFEAVLNALPKNKQTQLGYRPGQGRFFKQWVMVKTQTPAERRTVLLAPPIRPRADHEDMMLLRGPGLSTRKATLTERAQDLYPHFNEREVDTFVQSLGSPEQGHQTLTRLDRELHDLEVLLNKWRYRQPDSWGPDRQGFVRGGGLHISERLIDCFRRKPTVFGERSTTSDGGYALDLSTEIDAVDLERWWKELPDIKHYLDQITTLNLDRTTFSQNASGLLKDFPHLRQLSARGCGLTQLPDSIGKMHYLRTLRLMNNDIRLTPASVGQLRNLTRIETLRLDDNPRLGMLPNVERMPRLSILSLSNTGATAWPDGLFAPNKRRPRGFFLDLQENPIRIIPTVVPGSDDAFIVARTRLFEMNLSQANVVKFQAYRRSVGISPTQVYTDAATDAMAQWPMKDDSEWWSAEVSGLGTFRQEAWHDLMSEPGSEGFFALIQKQTTSADYRAGGELRNQLSSRVWRMVEAVDLDSELRADLFEMATSPTTCADAGAQMFNHMGIKVLASEAYALSTSGAMLESRLVRLAKGAARLARVEDIARADFAKRPGGDEIEVYLAYESGLAQRLDLPWQSTLLRYPELARVNAEMLDTAFDTVMSMEAGDGLVNGMIEQPYWEKYLRDTYPAEFRRNARMYEHRTDLLDELREAQRAWAGSKEQLIVQRRALKQRLLDLASQLNVPESLVLTGEEMTDEVYGGLLNDIGYEEKQLSRRLTRAALQNAG
ncbi:MULTISPECIES: NEL-type E3 ubiquitin ligase domain-containing protein [Pseudomonas]|uniref:NEL-type E3 ubiquitin ligase domain-containing protein n=1 Tax=Pseudomonas TaxID=286 RepID=UPI00298D2301|nr:NEL-type E3 ubiquitin ligase domain-containing protein [Pseudomonas sp. PDM07]